MKRTLIICTAALITTVCSLFYFIKDAAPVQPVNKSISVEVYKSASYVSPVYSNATAALEVTIIRVKNDMKDTVWQHSFEPTALKNFPEADKPITQRISISNVNDCKEALEIHYKIVYNSLGSILNYRNYTTIGQGQQSGKLDIKI